MSVSTDPQKQQCTNCKCWRDLQDYIGAKNVPVKRCVKCREKDAKQKQKPEVREIRNERQREKQYYKEHREKKREENEEEYLKHNAEIAKIWRNNNKEHVAAFKTNNFKVRFHAIKSQANKKSITWDNSMSDEHCKNLMISPCFYCNFISDKTLNGIDRMDSASYYTSDNCVSCCKQCNYMKTSLDVNTFIKRCKHISKYHNAPGILNHNIWNNSQSTSYTNYKTRADKKTLEFSLSKEDFNDIIKNACYYCGKENTLLHKNGIDRKNNTIGYTLTNSVTCCTECNYMKGMLNEGDFIEQCKKIARYKDTAEDITNIPQCLTVICKRFKKDLN
jgi:hypothetical protein